MKFGIGEGKADELDTCLQLYLVPYRDAYRLIRRRLRRTARRAERRIAVPADLDP